MEFNLRDALKFPLFLDIQQWKISIILLYCWSFLHQFSFILDTDRSFSKLHKSMMNLMRKLCCQHMFDGEKKNEMFWCREKKPTADIKFSLFLITFRDMISLLLRKKIISDSYGFLTLFFMNDFFRYLKLSKRKRYKKNIKGKEIQNLFLDKVKNCITCATYIAIV